MNKINEVVIEKFYERIEKTEGCWLWKAGKRGHGYGAFSLLGRTVAAHRFMYELENGEIPKGKHVLHTCDNPLCVNPEHLFIGTHTDNMQDKKAKGRTVAFKGEKNPSAILTKEQAMEVRKRAKAGERQVDLAAEFGISQPTVSAIKVGRIW